MKLNVGRSNIYLDQTKQKKKRKEKNTEAIIDMLLKKRPPSEYQYHKKLQAHVNRHTEKIFISIDTTSTALFCKYYRAATLDPDEHVG